MLLSFNLNNIDCFSSIIYGYISQLSVASKYSNPLSFASSSVFDTSSQINLLRLSCTVLFEAQYAAATCGMPLMTRLARNFPNVGARRICCDIKNE